MKCDVLIVDDVKNNLLALRALLESDNLNIYEAQSGPQALELMLKHDFCLAILDVNMPVMSGFELAEMMRGSKRTKNIPIIFVTATATEQNFSFKGYESGAVDFLLKPLDAHAVRSKVRIFVQLFQQQMELKIQLAKIAGLLDDLSKSEAAADKANASKTLFLAHMSHEIRTPLGAILGFADLMKNPANTPEKNQECMAIVERNSQQLLRLLDDILDLSKVEAGKMSIENIGFSLSEMFSGFAATMALKAKGKGIEFKFVTETPIPDLICSDPHRLRQILNNVVGNAIKFTEKGSVQVFISYSEPCLKFRVVDTGLGISPDQEIKLFQPFTQADPSNTRKFGGTGLGLVLSRHLAESLGGRLIFVPTTKGGSTFVAEITASPSPGAKMVEEFTQTKIQPAKAALQGLKVLLVEDSLDNQMLINMYLEKEGVQLRIASDGERGVELALSENFDVVIMDIQMPMMDGHEATRILRQSKYEKPIVALTAHAMKEERLKCQESGFNDFLTKPIQLELLIDILGKYSPITVPSRTVSI